MRNPRIVLYGHFGSGNIGNDSSLEAALYHIKRYRPDAYIVCVCNSPREVARDFGIETFPMSEPQADEFSAGRSGSRVGRLVQRLAAEFRFWKDRPSWFRHGDLFIVVGTGAVDDMAVKRPWHSPYELYKWCRAAKMGGARVMFLSVGVGPILNRISRFLMLKALRMADYRSYREVAAFQYLKGIGFDTAGDHLYPDLVFSLPEELVAVAAGKSSSAKVVGLGLISYYGWRNDPGSGEAIYQEYLSKLKLFALWLFQQGYQVRVLFGDTTDLRPVQDFSEFIAREYKTGGQNMITIGKITNVRELFEQIAQTDVVVASRFHNVVCSLMLERPVISLGYHEKNANLMAEMGLAKYCQHIEEFTFERLVEQFECYTTEMDAAVGQIHDRNAQYRQSLDEQYRNILLPAQN